MSIENKTTAISKTLLIICPLVAVAFVSHKFLTVFAADVPRELREMNLVVFAKAFSEGRNLYQPSVLDTYIPTATNLYGFLAPLLISLFIRISEGIGLSALRVSEITALIIECIGIWFAYKALLLRTGKAAYSLLGAIILDSCYWRYSAFGGSFPDQWGLTVGFLLTYLIIKDERDKKYHPYIYALIIILLFYIKQYFIFWLVGVGVYLMLKSVGDFIKYAVTGIIGGIISIFAVDKMFPLYFGEVFPIAQGSTGNNSITDSLKQVIEQTVWSYKALVFFLFIFVVYSIWERKKGKVTGNSFRDSVFTYYEFCQMICVFPFSIIISRNEGTRYTYNLQLWWPYVIIFALSLLPVMAKKLMPYRIKAGHIIVFVVIAYCLWDCKSLIISKPLNNDQINAWDNAYEILDRYSEEGDILVSPHLSAYCLENGIETSDYGQAEFNSADSLRGYLNNKLWVTLFPETERLLRNNIEYNTLILDKIYRHGYTCIALTDSARYWLDESDIIAAGYSVDTEMELVAGGETLPTVFYVWNTEN